MSGFKTLYHIGPRKPIPRPNPFFGWDRPQFEEPIIEPVVFLTPSWKRVWSSHGVHGNIYIFKVPNWMVRRCGIKKYDYAPEIIIPEKYWKECKLIEKIDHKEAEKIKKLEDNHRKTNLAPPGSCVEDSPNAQEIKWKRLEKEWDKQKNKTHARKV